MKKTIRLTESELKWIVKESVNKVLRESSDPWNNFLKIDEKWKKLIKRDALFVLMKKVERYFHYFGHDLTPYDDYETFVEDMRTILDNLGSKDTHMLGFRVLNLDDSSINIEQRANVGEEYGEDKWEIRHFKIPTYDFYEYYQNKTAN
jgi:hypothetical protein